MKNKKETKVYGIVGVILTSLAIIPLMFMPYFGLPLSIIGLVSGCKGKGVLKILSIVFGSIGIVINSIVLLIVIALLLVGAL